MSRVTHHDLILEDATMLAPSVRLLGFRTSQGEPFSFAAGQFVNLYLDSPEGRIKRAYSVASAPAPERPDRVEIAVTLVDGGPMSTALHRMNVGDGIPMEGPWGVFVRPEAHRELPAIFVGTGTGLAPLRAMLVDELRASKPTPPMVVLFGCRTPADILWREELETLSRNHPHVEFHTTLSRAGEDWQGRKGYVQAHLPEFVRRFDASHVYVCGLSPMVVAVRKVLKEDLGIDRKFVHAERYD